ncbi:MAG: DUF1801 domain-containing protein [Pikeienuella sp.]
MTPDEAFAVIPSEVQRPLADIRALIHRIAGETPDVGAIVEEVKWGQLSFSTKPRTGSPIRIGQLKSGEPALFAHCQTTLMNDFAAGPGAGLSFEGSRAVVVPEDAELLVPLIRAALTYHEKQQK